MPHQKQGRLALAAMHSAEIIKVQRDENRAMRPRQVVIQRGGNP